MSFSWMDRTPPRTDGADRRAKVACTELASRAGLLFRLGFTAEAATRRLIDRTAWEYDGDLRPESLSDQAIAKIVTDTFARRPG